MADQPLTAGADIVLVADDNAFLRSKIVDFLTLEGIRSVDAADGKMALSEALFVQPSVVLLDIKMPAIDGYTAAKLIVELPWRPKVILMSGFYESVRLANKAYLSVFAVLEKSGTAQITCPLSLGSARQPIWLALV